MRVQIPDDKITLGANVKGVHKDTSAIKSPRSLVATALALAIVGIGVGTGAWLLKQSNLQDGLDSLERRNNELAEQIDTANTQNKLLSDQVLLLSEKTLEWQRKYAQDVTALSGALDTAKATSTIIFSESSPVGRSTQTPPPAETSGDWFINFETYYAPATAAARALEIRESLTAFDVKVIASVAADGRQVYRVRAEGFSDKQASDDAALWIAQRLDTADLWIGRTSIEKAELASPKPNRVLRHVVFVGEYIEPEQASAVASALTNNGLNAQSAPYSEGQKITHRVYVIDLPDKDSAEAILRSLSKTGSFRGAKVLKSFNVVD